MRYRPGISPGRGPRPPPRSGTNRKWIRFGHAHFRSVENFRLFAPVAPFPSETAGRPPVAALPPTGRCPGPNLRVLGRGVGELWGAKNFAPEIFAPAPSEILCVHVDPARCGDGARPRKETALVRSKSLFGKRRFWGSSDLGARPHFLTLRPPYLGNPGR